MQHHAVVSYCVLPGKLYSIACQSILASLDVRSSKATHASHLVQVMSEHAKAGGWYNDLVPKSQEALKLTSACPPEIAWEDVVLELAGTHGLWNDLAGLIRWPGVSAILTGDGC